MRHRLYFHDEFNGINHTQNHKMNLHVPLLPSRRSKSSAILFVHILLALTTSIHSWGFNLAEAKRLLVHQRILPIMCIVTGPKKSKLREKDPAEEAPTTSKELHIKGIPSFPEAAPVHELAETCQADCCAHDEEVEKTKHKHSSHDDSHQHESNNKQKIPRSVNESFLKVTSASPMVTEEQYKIGGDQVLFVDDPCDLYKIQNSRIQLAVLRQKSIPDFITKLSDPSIAKEDLPAFEANVYVEEGLVGHQLKKHLSKERYKDILDEKDMDQLLKHTEELVHVFANIAKDAGHLGDDAPFVFVKLKVFENDGCAYWHQDCVPFRMLTTFRGPCTEWVPPAYSRETLERRKFNSEHAQSLSHNDVALFKGCGAQTVSIDDLDDDGLDHPGIVHRSPRLEGSGVCRLVLKIDIPQDWHFQGS